MKVLKFILLAIILFTSAGLVALGYFNYVISSPLDDTDMETSIFIVEQGEGLSRIAQRLEEENLIKNSFYFSLYATLEGQARNLHAGVYELSPSMSTKEVAEHLAQGNALISTRVTIPEGTSSAAIARRLASEGVLQSETEFLNFINLSTPAASGMFDFSFLRRVNALSLEGFLFPDTYEFKPMEDARSVMNKFLSNFAARTEHIFTQTGTGQATEYSPYEIIIMASLIEKEVQTEQDMKLVAGVLYNRLEIGMALQVDATLVYITGKSTRQLTNADKFINHPFNTYQNRGLPPAPITNPGLQAINAAFDPTPNEYIYYLSAEDGSTIFARTLEEHNRNREIYLQYLRR